MLCLLAAILQFSDEAMKHESFASHSHADATEAWRAASGI
jgi:hypothetical protein